MFTVLYTIIYVDRRSLAMHQGKSTEDAVRWTIFTNQNVNRQDLKYTAKLLGTPDVSDAK